MQIPYIDIADTDVVFAAHLWLIATAATLGIDRPHAGPPQLFDPVHWFFVERSGSIRKCQPDNTAGLTPAFFVPRESLPL